MVRLLVLFQAGDRDAAPRIRAAARALSGIRGLVVVKGSGRMAAPGAGLGPVVELGFESPEAMRAALATDAWRRLAAAGNGGEPRLHAYHVDTLVLGGAPWRGPAATTDLEVAREERRAQAPAEPISTELHYPSRPGPPDEAA